MPKPLLIRAPEVGAVDFVAPYSRPGFRGAERIAHMARVKVLWRHRENVRRATRTLAILAASATAFGGVAAVVVSFCL